MTAPQARSGQIQGGAPTASSLDLPIDVPDREYWLRVMTGSGEPDPDRLATLMDYLTSKVDQAWAERAFRDEERERLQARIRQAEAAGAGALARIDANLAAIERLMRG